jgi:hypothetical protein
MNTANFTGIHISKADYFKLPADMRAIGDGPMVLSMLAGRATFVPAIIIGN